MPVQIFVSIYFVDSKIHSYAVHANANANRHAIEELITSISYTSRESATAVGSVMRNTDTCLRFFGSSRGGLRGGVSMAAVFR